MRPIVNSASEDQIEVGRETRRGALKRFVTETGMAAGGRSLPVSLRE